MKYSITIEWDTKKEIGDFLYVFPAYPQEEMTLEKIAHYCSYKEVVIDAIKPKLHQNINWNGALIFEYMCWIAAYYSDDIAVSFHKNSYRRVYYNKEDADEERAQRIESIHQKLKSFTSERGNK